MKKVGTYWICEYMKLVYVIVEYQQIGHLRQANVMFSSNINPKYPQWRTVVSMANDIPSSEDEYLLETIK